MNWSKLFGLLTPAKHELARSFQEHLQILLTGKVNERQWRRSQLLESPWLPETELLALRPQEWGTNLHTGW